MDFLTNLFGALSEAALWVWTNGATVGALAAAAFTACYVWLTFGILRLQQTPVVTADDSKGVGELEDNHELRSLRNSGQGPAFNVCIHQQGQLDLLEFSWLGSLGPREVRNLPRRVLISYVEDHPHLIWYQDAGRRWYATKLAAHGYGLASVWQGKKWRLMVPRIVREHAKAETVVEHYNRLARWKGLRTLWPWRKSS